MYAPHTVTVFNAQENGLPIATILRGVFLDISKAANVRSSGLENADAATLFVPFSVEAVNAETGKPQRYLKPKEYEDQLEREDFWTFRSGGTYGANDCFFAKGEITEPEKFQTINGRYDDVYRVSSVDTRDFGTEDMRHWQVGGR